MQSIIQSIVDEIVTQKEIQKAKSKYFNTECPICLDKYEENKIRSIRFCGNRRG